MIPDSVTTIGDTAFSGASSVTIYSEAVSQPLDWDSTWNPLDKPVVWGYTAG